MAQTIVAVLRSAGLHRRQRRCYVPQDILAAAGLDLSGWLDSEPGERHRAAIGAMVALGREHLEKSRSAIAEQDRGLRRVFLPLAPLPAYLDLVERSGEGVLTRPIDITPLRRQWLFLKAVLRS